MRIVTPKHKSYIIQPPCYTLPCYMQHAKHPKSVNLNVPKPNCTLKHTITHCLCYENTQCQYCLTLPYPKHKHCPYV